MKRFLLIDDDIPTNYYNSKILKKVIQEVDIIQLDNVQDALTYLDNPENPKVDFIFLDINMPEMNGWEFLESYKSIPKGMHADTLVIMLTTSLNPFDQKKAEENPFVNSFLTKPLTKDKIEKIINT
ncbi:response regulator [Flammeovirga pacifica]|uniref:Response regulatory domain-containing protein n=1 Tax=Flammeovirga pacifica TaxID=915059 RepID=A0A1S1YZP3_FLAPC|nr:response regulator [Flammeovirga pacifica]OHX66403.1 hypothetical protein NH26_08565 [Flammeovirga pacifica]